MTTTHMNTTTHKTIPAEGETVWLNGHEFIARNVRVEVNQNTPGGWRCVRFTGTCTSHPANDQIRNTYYDGGTYGWRVS